MRKLITLLFLAILLTSLASAEMIITKQPKSSYNLGDFVNVPITIKATSDISGIFQMDLLCNGHELNFYKNGVGLKMGQEKKMEPSLILTKNMIGDITGICKIKGVFNEEYILTDDFTISGALTVSITTEQTSFSPGDYIQIKGEAVKENGEDVQGFVELKMLSLDTSEEIILETVSNGFFFFNISLLENMKAGDYTLSFDVYEKDSEGEITNFGFGNYNINIIQIPTNLEIIFEDTEVEPGTNLQVKAILHDQSGDNIESTTTLLIKDKKENIRDQVEISTGETWEFPIAYNEPVSELIVKASSNKLEAESSFLIREKKEVSFAIMNKTLILTNVGNVPYNDSLLIKIGEEPLNMYVNLDVDEMKKYILSAPDGEYGVEIITDDGSQLNEQITLTGKAIDIRQASSGVGSMVRYPFVWIFIIGIMGFMAFMVFKKGYKRSFIGRINLKRKKKHPTFESKEISSIKSRSSGFLIKNRAELSLSIKGEKQNTSLICLKIKNLKEIQNTKEGNTMETIQKIIGVAEENKAVTYDGQENLFFIFAPVKTKTFNNEKAAVITAQKIFLLLTNYNKMAKQKIEFGIGLNYGTIVAKPEPNGIKFMSMGTFITVSKKLANFSDGKIILGEKIKEKIPPSIKLTKHTKDKLTIYTIKEIKNPEAHEQFLKSFIKRMEKK